MAAVEGDKVYTSLLTNLKYLPGLLTLEFSLRKTGSKYPFLVLYTDSLEQEGLDALDRRGIPHQRVAYLLPKAHRDYGNDARFYDCWSKLQPFSMTQYTRVIQLDSDMLLLSRKDPATGTELLGIDPLMTLPLSPQIFAATHACVCNPHSKPHYPSNFTPSNCAYTTQHADPNLAQTQGAPASAGLSMCNGGLQVVSPNKEDYDTILRHLEEPGRTEGYDFADQSLLSDAFRGRWVPLPYVYNALKTLRYAHKEIWRDEEVRNIHYILSPKPWEETEEDKASPERDPLMALWWEVNEERKGAERERGVVDGW
ncbi:glycosyl transferase family protein, partial [Ascobolus immersus RN42]